MAVRVQLGERAYDVVVGRLGFGEVARRIGAAVPGAKAAFLVVDSGLPAEAALALADALAQRGTRVVRWSIDAREDAKSLSTVASMLEAFAAERLERSDAVIALGGGVVGDVAGFAAGIYRRGVALIQCPTTLLAMVDASVGGKTGVNLQVAAGGSRTLQKNMVGVFHQPRLVVADVGMLGTLPSRHLRAGLAECIKHGLIGGQGGDSGLLAWTEENLGAVLRLEAPVIELVERNVALKARVVAGDEREEAPDDAGGRAILNLGHTFGHAIETIPGLSPDGHPSNAPLLHGEAVGLGLVAAGACAHAMGVCESGTMASIRRAVSAAGLPTTVAGLPGDDEVLARMRGDKKTLGGSMRLVLPEGAGRARVVRDPPLDAVVAGLAAIRVRQT